MKKIKIKPQIIYIILLILGVISVAYGIYLNSYRLELLHANSPADTNAAGLFVLFLLPFLLFTDLILIILNFYIKVISYVCIWDGGLLILNSVISLIGEKNHSVKLYKAARIMNLILIVPSMILEIIVLTLKLSNSPTDPWIYTIINCIVSFLTISIIPIKFFRHYGKKLK